MIYVTGDLHREIERLMLFCEKNKTTKDDTLIILGDAGFNYYGGSADCALKRDAQMLPITLFCVKGNHENDAGNIAGYVEGSFCGGKVLFESEYPSLLFPPCGEVFLFNSKKAIVIGGAYSVDKFIRIRYGYHWFEDEQPSLEIKSRVEQRLSAEGWKVDYVLSHTVPLRYEPREWFHGTIDQNRVDKTTEQWLDGILDRLEFKRWYCGHFHGEKTVDSICFLYEGYRELGK